MAKTLTTAALLALILLSFGFVGLKTSALGDQDNYFNQNWRAGFAAKPWLRQILGLHDYGDARSDYLGAGYPQILVEVDAMQGLRMSRTALNLTAERIEEVTGKRVSFLISDPAIVYSETVDEEGLETIASLYRNFESSRGRAVVYLLYLSQDAEIDTLLGKTFQEFGMVLFGDTLRDFTKASPKTLPAYETSTALHEFGHLVGLEHNGEPGCLMNEEVEIAFSARVDPDEVSTQFCQFEKEQISL